MLTKRGLLGCWLAVSIALRASGMRLIEKDTVRCANCFCFLRSAVQCGTTVVEDSALCGTDFIEDAGRCGVDVVEDASRCGTDTVEDAARCGTETIRDIARCGKDILKSCGWSRRRSLGELRCSFKDAAKSCSVAKKCAVPRKCSVAKKCSVPKKCSVGKECNVPQSFGDCLMALGGGLSGQAKEYFGLITKSGCTGVDSCRDKVLGGLEGAWKLAANGLQGAAEDQFSTVAGQGAPMVKETIAAVKAQGGDVVKVLSDVAGHIQNGFTATFDQRFQKYSLGKLCSKPGTGFWSMVPTDCGAFGEMDKIFSGNLLDAPGRFKSAGTKFQECVSKMGLLKVPTPFLELKVTQFCVPQFLVTPVEYFMGAVMYVSNAAQPIAGQLTQLISKLVSFVEKDLKSLNLGRAVQQARLGASSALLEQEDEEALASDPCGPSPSWAVQVGVSTGLSAIDATGNTVSFSFGTSILAGCKDGEVLLPNWLLHLSLARSVQGGNDYEPPSAGVQLQVKFSAEYPSFENRFAFGAGLDITPSVAIKDVVEAGLPISFAVLPGELPSGFAVALQTKLGGSLAELGTSIRDASTSASRRAHEAGSDGITAAISSAISGLAASTQLDAAFEDVGRNRAEVLKRAVAVQKHGEALAATALRRKTGLPQSEASSSSFLEAVPIEVDLAVEASVGFDFCVTPTQCFGS